MEFKPKDLEFTYGTRMKVETVEAKGKRKVFLGTTFMDNSINKNGWRLPQEELDNIAKQVNGNPLKIAHSKSDWDILGTGVEGRVDGNTIKARDEVTDPDAISKFESGTWNEKNMGISPRVRFESIACSICGEKVSAANRPIETHRHKMNQKYDNEKCFYDVMGAKLIERSLTSEPAYRPTAGNIDSVTLSASLQRFVNNSKTEEKNMSGESNKNSLEAVLSEKDNRIEQLAAENATKIKTIEDLEASVKELKKLEPLKEKHEKLEAELKEKKEKLGEFVQAKRKAELSEVIKDEEVIAETLKKELTDEEFEAEVKRIKKIMTVSANAPADKGTISAEKKTEKHKGLEAKFGTEMFGGNYQELIGEKKEGDK